MYEASLPNYQLHFNQRAFIWPYLKNGQLTPSNISQALIILCEKYLPACCFKNCSWVWNITQSKFNFLICNLWYQLHGEVQPYSNTCMWYWSGAVCDHLKHGFTYPDNYTRLYQLVFVCIESLDKME